MPGHKEKNALADDSPPKLSDNVGDGIYLVF